MIRRARKSDKISTLRAQYLRLKRRKREDEVGAVDSVLLLEDNETLAKHLKAGLELANFKVSHAATLSEARKLLLRERFSVLLFDVNLPDGTGFELCQEVVEAQLDAPVIFLTAKTDEESAVEGLSLGAKDYVRKPFQIRELVARMRAQIARSGQAGKQAQYEGIVIDMAERRAKYRDKELELSRGEFDVFSYLVRHGGNLVDREKCLEEIDSGSEVNSRSLNVVVSRIRKKLAGAGAKDVVIASEYGIGYRLVKK
jgi:DNA-binding response OmpR family regulator